MGELTTSENTNLVSLMHGKGGALDMPIPFERDIFLFTTTVAGTSHIEGIDELEPHLAENDKLDFFREPDNPHDKSAIVIKNADGIKIGYVPQHDNIIFSRLMDAGKLLFGRISSKKWKGKWLKITIEIYLHE